MATQRRMDTEEYQAATETARRVLARVADQLSANIVEADRLAGPGDVRRRVELIAGAQARIRGAQAAQERAREMGMRVAPAVRAEHEAIAVLRENVMGCAAALGAWAAQIDLQYVSGSNGTVE